MFLIMFEGKKLRPAVARILLVQNRFTFILITG